MDNWKRAITVLNKLETAGIDLNHLMKVMNPIQARRAKKLVLGHADITEGDLDLIETAMAGLSEANSGFVKPRQKKTEMWIERQLHGTGWRK